MIIQILEILAPVGCLALIGYVWARSGADFDITFVSRLAMNFAVPCLLFTTLVKVELDPEALQDMALAACALYGAAAATLAVLLALGRLEMRSYLAPLVFGNTGNVGLPICLFAFGEEGLALGMIVFAVMAIGSFTVGVWLVSGEASPKAALSQPVFYGAAIGGAWAFFDIAPPPEWIMETMALVGQIAIPIMLITLGVSIAQLSSSGAGLAIVLSVVKVALLMVAGLGVAELFGLTGAARGALILQAVMPVPVTSYLLAERYNAKPNEVAGLVVVSTVLSAAALPLVLALVLGDPAILA